MRRLLALSLLLLATSAAQAATLDPERIAAIDRAADAFVAKAAIATKTGMAPRETDPEIGPLLDAVFDINPLSHGTIDYADFHKLSDWLRRIAQVGNTYVAVARQTRDAGVVAAELGRYVDAAVAVTGALADSMGHELAMHPDAKLPSADQQSVAKMRDEVAGVFTNFINMLHWPGLTVGWEWQRLDRLAATAPSLARFLTTAQLVQLRAATLRQAARVRDKKLRAEYDRLAAALAEPPPPPVTAANAPASEIPLEHAGNGDFRVPVRVDDAITADFIIDSGAAIVALPSDMVESLVKAGAMAESDRLGAGKYVAADGKRHKAARVLLRRLEVGGHTVTNIVALVVPAKTEPLLGQSFFAKFKSWTLDNQRHVLIISE